MDVIERSYQDTLNWIHSTMRFGSKPGLERISKLLELLGNPERGGKFLHVAGTNGKGSVTAYIASVLKEAGYRTGMYISPYLEDFRERIMLNNRKIPKQDLCEVADTARRAVEEMLRLGHEHPTEFELITAMALLWYSKSQCDYVSLEVGLGGRFDATNVVRPCVSVITTIDYDHTDRLGNTLAQIAFEKSGIIKRQIPVVTGALEDEAFDVISKRALQESSALVGVGTNARSVVRWEETSYSLEGQTINLYGPTFEYKDLYIPLLGRHQQLNAALAVAAIHAATPENNYRSIYVDEQAVRQGISKTVWPGRFEVLHRDPLVILDGAHNPHGARALAKALDDVKVPIICVFGMLKDKSYAEATSAIVPRCEEVIVTAPDTPRALDPNELAQEVKKHCSRVWVESDLEKALEKALDSAGSSKAVLCCGSLYLVGPARTYLRHRFGILPFGGE